MKWIIALLSTIAVQVAAEDFSGVELDAKNWYEASYVPLWREARTIDLDEVRKHYIKGYRLHLARGGYESFANTVEEWRNSLKIFGENWVGSDLLTLKISALDQNTVAIWSEFVNRNDDGTTFSNCANYVAGRSTETAWKFYDLFITDCSAADLAGY